MNFRQNLARLGFAVAIVCGLGSGAAEAALPDIIKEPGALNLGGTTFFDGFGRLDEGFTFLQYGHFSQLERFTTESGATNPAFVNPRIRSEATLEQLSFTTNMHPFGGAIAFSAALPFINFDSHFDPSGVVLHDNHFGIGDITWGPIFQSAPIMSEGRPVFSWRVQLQIISPAGSFDPSKNLNQGSGFWALNPYFTFTVLPLPRWELSARTHYLYNFKGTSFSNPPLIPGLVYNNGQAGTLWFMNFAGSYAVTDSFFAGFNGYYLQQFNDDKLNGIEIPNTKQKFLYIGPGGRYNFDKDNFLNLNLYLPAFAYNVASGTQYNFQFVHRF